MNRLLAAALVAFASPVLAQPIDIAELDALFESEPQVEVNLRGSLIRLAVEAAAADAPETAAMLDGVRAVTVRVYASPPAVRGSAVDRFADLGRRFEAEGWYTLVRVRALANDDVDESDVWIYARDAADSFDGLAVMVVDPADENAVFVYIDGTIDPANVGALSRRFAQVTIDEDDDEEEDDDR